MQCDTFQQKPIKCIGYIRDNICYRYSSIDLVNSQYATKAEKVSVSTKIFVGCYITDNTRCRSSNLYFVNSEHAFKGRKSKF